MGSVWNSGMVLLFVLSSMGRATESEKESSWDRCSQSLPVAVKSSKDPGSIYEPFFLFGEKQKIAFFLKDGTRHVGWVTGYKNNEIEFVTEVQGKRQPVTFPQSEIDPSRTEHLGIEGMPRE